MLMQRKYDVYLAGAMHTRPVGEVVAERERARNYCDMYEVTYYDPSLDEGLERLEPGSLIDAKPNIELMQHYVHKDEENLEKCKAILVLTGDKSSAGVGWELAKAYYELGIPIFLVAPKMATGQLVNFTTIKADFICETQEEAVSLLANYLSVKGE